MGPPLDRKLREEKRRILSAPLKSPDALSGFKLLPDYLDRAAQQSLLAEVAVLFEVSPPYQPTMPRTGQPMSVTMTNAGPLGWVTDKEGGYRYQARHPVTGEPWPPIPESVLDIWRAVGGCGALPEACLVNLYGETARMGLHVDRDEEDRSAPVVSISLGDTALFRLGGVTRKDPTRSVKLASGAVVVLGGEARMAHHGVDRIYPGTSRLLEDFPIPGIRRINLTLRRVTRI